MFQTKFTEMYLCCGGAKSSSFTSSDGLCRILRNLRRLNRKEKTVSDNKMRKVKCIFQLHFSYLYMPFRSFSSCLGCYGFSGCLGGFPRIKNDNGASNYPPNIADKEEN
jgi:hypothetical protein